MKKLPFEIEVIFVKKHSIWRTVGLKQMIEEKDLRILKKKLFDLGYTLHATNGYSKAWFTLTNS